MSRQLTKFSLNAPPPPRALDVRAVEAALSLALDTPPFGSCLTGALCQAWRFSPFLKRLMQQQPQTLHRLLTDGPDALITDALMQPASWRDTAKDAEMQVRSGLRQARSTIALITGLADMAGLWDLTKVTNTLSRFADSSLNIALAAALMAEGLENDVENCGITLLALGKLGGFELNYSSDVDLIILYDPRRIPGSDADDKAAVLARLVRRFLGILSDRTAQGYVHRVDLRLRPDPDSTPAALPVEAALGYYQSAALTWERSAFLKARPAAGDTALGMRFLAEIDSFIWRRSLDFTVIRDIHAMSLDIRDHFQQESLTGPGYDVKRGRGGIREIEFFVSVHQLIHGGRLPALRVRPTLAALEVARHLGLVPDGDARILVASYHRLRAIEHRLQMVDDQQTHLLPRHDAAFLQAARLCSFRTAPALTKAVQQASAPVSTLYDALTQRLALSQTSTPVTANPLATPAPTLPRTTAALSMALKTAGIACAKDMAAQITQWRGENWRALKVPDARAAFERLLPALVTALAATDAPLVTAQRFGQFMAGQTSGVRLLTLFEMRPRLLSLLARLLSLAAPIAQSLTRRPELFDAVVAPDFYQPMPPASALKEALLARLALKPTLEQRLDEARFWAQERWFQIGLLTLDALAPPAEARTAYTAVADALVQALTTEVTHAFAARHGIVAGGNLIVLGLGRYGGGAMTAGADLDLIFLFSGAHDRVSDGPTPLSATLYFNRLAQRLITALSAPTAAGRLFDIDTRLRPHSSKGLLAVSVDSFFTYQQQEAWTAEHAALTRLRPVVASAGDRADLMARCATLWSKIAQGRATIRPHLQTLHTEMTSAHPPQSFWDIKRQHGGLLMLELLVQALMLEQADRLTIAPDLAACLPALATSGCLSPQQVETLRRALTFYQDLLTTLRLGYLAPPQTSDLGPGFVQWLTRTLNVADLAALEEQVKATTRAVADLWHQIFIAPR